MYFQAQSYTLSGIIKVIKTGTSTKRPIREFARDDGFRYFYGILTNNYSSYVGFQSIACHSIPAACRRRQRLRLVPHRFYPDSFGMDSRRDRSVDNPQQREITFFSGTNFAVTNNVANFEVTSLPSGGETMGMTGFDSV